MKFSTISVLVCLVAPSVGCAVLPADGPTSFDKVAAVNPEADVQFELVNVTPSVLSILEHRRPSGDFGQFDTKSPPSMVRLGPGDVIGVTIFESSAGGLFIPAEPGTRTGNFVTVPDQQVDRNGLISVPYAGQIQVAGKGINEVQKAIEQKLAARALEPQVVVTIRERNSAQVSVLGAVNAAQKYNLNPRGERLLEAIAKAGGPSQQGYDTFVTVQRGSRKATMYFQRIVNEPGNNIWLQPGDVVYVYKETRTFIALGAQGQNGRFVFDTEAITLSDALGKAGGLLDERANPGSVFVYRFEDRAIAEKIGVDVTKYRDSKVPIVYRINLREGGGYFVSADMQILNRDVIFVGNSAYTEIIKALTLYRTTVAAGTETQGLKGW